MENFINAHKGQSMKSAVKAKKSKKNKKQLQKMMYGYNQNDNAVIKSANKIVEDNSSSDSYVDLNMTDLNINCDLSFSQSSSNSVLSIASDTGSHPKCQIEDISNVESLNPNSPAASDTKDVESYSPSFKSVTITTSSDDSQPFDMDGSLAVKIKEKLVAAEKKKTSKPNDENTKQSKAKDSKKKTISKRNLNKVDTAEVNKYIDLHRIEGELQTDDDYDETFDIYSSSRPLRSPQYVSITATELPNESLGDFLGDYKHTTFRNIPTDSTHASICSTNIFSSELNELEVEIEEMSDEVIPQSTLTFKGDIKDGMFSNDASVTDSLIENKQVEDVFDNFDNNPVSNNDKDDINDTIISIEDENETSNIVINETIDDQADNSQNLDTTFVETVKPYYLKNSCILVLKHPAEIYFNGKVNVTSLAGTVEVFGYRLRGDTNEIYAPNYSYSHCFKTVQNDNDYYGLFNKLTRTGLSVMESEEIVISLREYDAVIHLQRLISRKFDFVDNNFTVADIFAKVDRNVGGLQRVSNIVGCSIYLNRPWNCFDENSNWHKIYEMNSAQLRRSVVCGGKGVGKSTLLRYYVNKLLSESVPVLVLDLDPGQCEFTVAGNISATVVRSPLLGPNFTHLRKPDRMLNIGMINVMDNIERYTNAVSDLISYCSAKEEYQNMPWIVNTMGMCNMVGLKLLAYIILKIQPTLLMQLDANVPRKKFQYFMDINNVKMLYFERYRNDSMFKTVTFPQNLKYTSILFRPEVNISNRTCLASRDERYLNYLAYFGELLDIHRNTGFLEILPYEVPLGYLSIASNVQLHDNNVCKVLNGKVVALCSRATANATSRTFQLRKEPLLCYGHGLIRGMDAASGRVYCITPVAYEQLACVDTLLYADWTPELCSERELGAGCRVPYRVPSLQHHPQLMRTPRRRFNPLQLFKASRSA